MCCRDRQAKEGGHDEDDDDEPKNVVGRLVAWIKRGVAMLRARAIANGGGVLNRHLRSVYISGHHSMAAGEPADCWGRVELPIRWIQAATLIHVHKRHGLHGQLAPVCRGHCMSQVFSAMLIAMQMALPPGMRHHLKSAEKAFLVHVCMRGCACVCLTAGAQLSQAQHAGTCSNYRAGIGGLSMSLSNKFPSRQASMALHGGGSSIKAGGASMRGTIAAMLLAR